MDHLGPGPARVLAVDLQGKVDLGMDLEEREDLLVDWTGRVEKVRAKARENAGYAKAPNTYPGIAHIIKGRAKGPRPQNLARFLASKPP